MRPAKLLNQVLWSLFNLTLKKWFWLEILSNFLRPLFLRRQEGPPSAEVSLRDALTMANSAICSTPSTEWTPSWASSAMTISTKGSWKMDRPKSLHHLWPPLSKRQTLCTSSTWSMGRSRKKRLPMWTIKKANWWLPPWLGSFEKTQVWRSESSLLTRPKRSSLSPKLSRK